MDVWNVRKWPVSECYLSVGMPVIKRLMVIMIPVLKDSIFKRTDFLFVLIRRHVTFKIRVLGVGPTVFRGKFCQILQASSRNSAAYCGKSVQIPRLGHSLPFTTEN